MVEGDAAIGREAMRKVQWRILPLVMLAYLCAYADRVNVGFAAATMNADLGFSATVYGLGAGLFFLSYAIFEIPSNLMSVRYGSRKWLARILVSWGLLSAATMFVTTAWQFYLVRFLLGGAEAGFFPAVIYYFARWFPPAYRARAVSRFYLASPLSSIVLGAVSGWMLGLAGVAGLKGWQWLFLLQGLPSVLVGVMLLMLLPERPEEAGWLDPREKAWIADELARDQARHGAAHGGFVAALRNPIVTQLGLFGFLLAGSVTTLMLSAPLLLAARTGDDVHGVGAIVSLGGAIGAVVMLAAGNFADSLRANLTHGLAYTAVLTLAYLALTLTGASWLTTGAYLIFAATCFTVPMLMVTGWIEVLPERELAVGGAAINTISQIGAFVTPFVWGMLKDATGGYQAGLALLTAMGVGMCLTLAWVCRGRRALIRPS